MSRKVQAFVLGTTAAGSYLFFDKYASASPEQKANNLSPSEFRPFKLVEIANVTHDTNTFVFHVDKPEIPCSSFVLARGPNKEGKETIRPYTPVMVEDQRLSLMIKQYKTGNLSEHIFGLKVGDTLDLKGPIEKFKFEPGKNKNVCFIAGGSGITPLLQIVRASLAAKKEQSNLYLVFANKTPGDILMKSYLDNLSKTNPNFKIKYLVENQVQPSMVEGRVTKDLLKSFFPAPSEDVKVYVCGPDPMMAAISGTKAPDRSQGELSGFLKELGYKPDQVFKY